MNWGIFTLLGFIGIVLVGVGAFGVFLIRRNAGAAPAGEGPAEFQDMEQLIDARNLIGCCEINPAPDAAGIRESAFEMGRA